MKCMLLLWIATLLNICHADTIANSPPDAEVTTFAQQARQKAEQYFDFKTGYFKPNITEQQKQQFYNDLLDSLVTTKEELYRFDRRELQPFISEPYRKKQELAIQKMADTCVQYIGSEPQDKDNNMLTLKQGETVITTRLNLPATKDSKEVLKHIQNNYLQGRIYKCSHFLYGDHYSLADFEFYDYAQPKTALFRKRQMLESLYEDLYFAIRKAGLLRTIPAMYYPKLSFRNHARTKGLMTYIDEQQKIANKKLNHEELAIQFFGSREKWITSFNDLIVSNYYPNSMVHNLCSNEKGKIGIPVLFINLNDNMMRVRDVFDGNFLVEGVKCQRRVTDTIILDYRDKLYARMTKFFKFELDSTLPKDWTKKQELQFYTDYTNARVETIEQLYRFNRASERTIFSANLVKGRVGNIEKQLDYCAKLIEKPIYTLDTSDWGPTYFRHDIAIDVMNLSNMTDDLYQLDGKLHQCISYIYGEKYNLSDFGYPNTQEMGSLTYSKKQQIEKLYTKIYLEIRRQRILRRLPAAFYPKSLVRAHADQVGLTQFINEQEELAGKKLPHDKLAVKYFGSYDKWIKSLNGYINKQL